MSFSKLQTKYLTHSSISVSWDKSTRSWRMDGTASKTKMAGSYCTSLIKSLTCMMCSMDLISRRGLSGGRRRYCWRWLMCMVLPWIRSSRGRSRSCCSLIRSRILRRLLLILMWRRKRLSRTFWFILWELRWLGLVNWCGCLGTRRRLESSSSCFRWRYSPLLENVSPMSSSSEITHICPSSWSSWVKSKI